MALPHNAYMIDDRSKCSRTTTGRQRGRDAIRNETVDRAWNGCMTVFSLGRGGLCVAYISKIGPTNEETKEGGDGGPKKNRAVYKSWSR